MNLKELKLNCFLAFLLLSTFASVLHDFLIQLDDTKCRWNVKKCEYVTCGFCGHPSIHPESVSFQIQISNFINYKQSN